jgi:hypothetical protein
LPACAIKPEDRRKQVRLVGSDLVKNYGRKPFYTVQEVKNANRRQGINYDVACWSHAFFNSHTDFDEYHKRIGEGCDYIAMKKEMAESVSFTPDAGSWFEMDFDFDLSWLELPSVDWSIFDFFDFS